jgi:hypothetical protein
MADNGIYSDGFNDGRHAALEELAELFNESDADDLWQRVEEFLTSEGAI